jgi:hypothetical protein
MHLASDTSASNGFHHRLDQDQLKVPSLPLCQFQNGMTDQISPQITKYLTTHHTNACTIFQSFGPRAHQPMPGWYHVEDKTINAPTGQPPNSCYLLLSPKQQHAAIDLEQSVSGQCVLSMANAAILPPSPKEKGFA